MFFYSKLAYIAINPDIDRALSEAVKTFYSLLFQPFLNIDSTLGITFPQFTLLCRISIARLLFFDVLTSIKNGLWLSGYSPTLGERP
ncbi:MAG: hypothetical protein NC828_01030 [Candidatus Omnitrophica bacterium]|nr:hypothetical protein [Candidatus Omnitrophota bacterium]